MKCRSARSAGEVPASHPLVPFRLLSDDAYVRRRRLLSVAAMPSAMDPCPCASHASSAVAVVN